ncbi:MAG TPA: FHA domain-containing protein [Thermoanaerobaculia bacterium]|nr:FHA domain-containing protein [Thermoanaerobaculia bacterium]
MAPETTGFTIMRELPRVLPEVLDLLVVGGGPGGTMAAFRARELGLSALVIDYDDVLKRIRDYSKDKLILPDFGGGDRMRFPDGGELCRKLHFQPIDKDEMHQRWKRFYLEHEVPVQVGLELTGLEREAEGVWRALVWDHNAREERRFLARAVAVAIGRGVPRRFDIPGNTDGIAYRLSDPALYLGRPACVVGGGTSAAEAVIAISAAKVAAEDPTAVYWSYRGDRLPRVSKALAEVFFEAYLGHGNIRYHPLSEPTAVVVGDDREEYLAIRVDRRCLDGRPHETVHLEFRKECCIACIGEDIPEGFLAQLRIPMVPVAGGERKRMLVTRHLESVQPGVFLVGDMLSQAYFETDDFAADPATYREVKHRGNIKSALRDGVLVAEVVAQKVAGATEIRVEVRDAEPAEEGGRTPEGAAPIPRETGELSAEPAGPPGEEALPEPEEARLVRILPGGVEEAEYPLPSGVAFTIGRGEGADLRFPDDAALSERHASIAPGEGGPVLRDDGGATGVFLRALPGEHTELPAGAVFRAGRQFLVLAQAAAPGDGGEPGSGAGWELRHFDHRGTEQGRHPVGEEARIFGRDAPDAVLDAADPSLSRRHFAVSVREGRVQLKDLKSVNGTWVKVKTAAVLRPGDELRLGRETLRYVPTGGALPGAALAPAPAPAPDAVREVAVPPRASEAAPAAASPTAAPAAASAVAAPAAASPQVTFESAGKTVALKPGQTICEAAEEHGLPINAECHAGICGSDPIRILSGAEHLGPLEGSEAETLEELCSLAPGEHRLACMCRARGPVVVELVAPRS